MMIDKLIALLATLHPDIPVYGNEITEEERLISQSFFIYRNTNRYSTGANGRGLYRELDLFYITAEQLEIDIADLVTQITDKMPMLALSGSTQEDFAKAQETDRTALMVTMTFRYMARKC